MLQPNIRVIDAIMGFGKTTAVIRELNESNRTSPFIYITPYLAEVDRIQLALSKHECITAPNDKPPGRKTKAKTTTVAQTKSEYIRPFLKDGRNLVITHDLFMLFNNEMLNHVKANSYDIIIDEVLNCIGLYRDTKHAARISDLKGMMGQGILHIDSGNRLRISEGFGELYRSMFSVIKRHCDSGSIYCHPIKEGKSSYHFFWMLPEQLLRSFSNITVLTYMFDASNMCAYFAMHGLRYERMTLDENNKIVKWCREIEIAKAKNALSLISLFDCERLNYVDAEEASFSTAWLKKLTTSQLTQLMNDIRNVLDNRFGARSGSTMLTCVSSVAPHIVPKGYFKSFTACNLRATNCYRHTVHLAYVRNVYQRPLLSNFLKTKGVQIDPNRYALSEFLQWMFRSAIRDGIEVNLYLPSKRMRGLLYSWVEE